MHFSHPHGEPLVIYQIMPSILDFGDEFTFSEFVDPTLHHLELNVTQFLAIQGVRQ